MRDVGEPLLTLRQAAVRLNLHPETVRYHILTGGLKACKVGRRWRVAQAEIERFLAGRQAARQARRERCRREAVEWLAEVQEAERVRQQKRGEKLGILAELRDPG